MEQVKQESNVLDPEEGYPYKIMICDFWVLCTDPEAVIQLAAAYGTPRGSKK